MMMKRMMLVFAMSCSFATAGEAERTRVVVVSLAGAFRRAEHEVARVFEQLDASLLLSG